MLQQCAKELKLDQMYKTMLLGTLLPVQNNSIRLLRMMHVQLNLKIYSGGQGC